MVDGECQLYGAFSLVFLSSNSFLQVPMVQMGSVRHLVTMIATNAEPMHYAALALLKLADNYETHITIAREGGIDALLAVGKRKGSNDKASYRAALTVSNLAKEAINRKLQRRPPKAINVNVTTKSVQSALSTPRNGVEEKNETKQV